MRTIHNGTLNLQGVGMQVAFHQSELQVKLQGGKKLLGIFNTNFKIVTQMMVEKLPGKHQRGQC